MCDNTFWSQDVRQLWCDWTLVPSQGDGIYVQLNTLTRLVIVLAVVVFAIRKSVEEAMVVLLVGVGCMALLYQFLPVPESTQ